MVSTLIETAADYEYRPSSVITGVSWLMRVVVWSRPASSMAHKNALCREEGIPIIQPTSLHKHPAMPRSKAGNGLNSKPSLRAMPTRVLNYKQAALSMLCPSSSALPHATYNEAVYGSHKLWPAIIWSTLRENFLPERFDRRRKSFFWPDELP